MAYQPSKSKMLTCTLTMHLETATGRTPSPEHMRAAAGATENAIRTRLFGDGFLPHDVVVDRYAFTFEPHAASAG